ncbi:SDR family oxidoreductase [Lentzea sp. NEAU-D13]|uniref:SDR family oxidoreductase n=2 Tax=Lentzea alba TaxID=2714351 RepID=A0A7C9RPN1_9PSEU|nr:SDR family oxidoreductase [Lentzea alba]
MPCQQKRRLATSSHLGRVGAAADIADAVAFFTTPDSRWVTGQVLEVNGGLYLGPRASLHH